MAEKKVTANGTSFGEEKKDDIIVLSSSTDSDADEDKESEPRRTGRKRTATTMIVQGHAVKTANNYTVTGMTYVHGTFTSDVTKSKPKQRRGPRTVARPSYVDDRLKHNATIKEKITEDQVARLNFMTDSISVLEPFLEPKILKYLQRHEETRKRTCSAKERSDHFSLSIQPDIVTTALRDYQMIGLEWMVKMYLRGMPMILGDEMGLGKTLQTISLISYLKEQQQQESDQCSGPSLVICPLSVLYSWCAEVDKHAPILKYFRFHSSNSDRAVQKISLTKDILKYDIIITTYEMIKTAEMQSIIRGTYFNVCVLDEGHVIKSQTTAIAQFVRKVHSQTKLILTGTPLQNNLTELYAILNYLYPDYFTTDEAFTNAFDIGNNSIDDSMLLKANKMLGLFMLRRLKVEVEKLMPKKIETKILCPLSSMQIFWYKGFLMNEVDAIIQASKNDGKGTNQTYQRLRNLVMQLRKCCLHPYLFSFAEQEIEKTTLEELIAASGKLSVLDKVLRSLFKKGNRTVIFSQFTSMLNILEDYCIQRGWRYCRFDGSTPRAQRNHFINQFNAPGSKDFIFLMSTRAGGLGINLQTADTCILYDSDWNPQPDLQAMARVHRIGQTKTVHVYRLVSAGTIEERVLERATKKLYLDQMVNRGASSNSLDQDGSGLSTADLLESLKFGSNAIFKSSNDLPTEDDVGKLTDRNRSETTSAGILTGGAANSAKGFDREKELTDTREFIGVDFRKLREEKEAKAPSCKSKFLNKLKQEWKEAKLPPPEEMGRGKRAKKSRIIQLDGKKSGYGMKTVPVLAMNDYDLLDGEPSVWRETKRYVQVQKKDKTEIKHQDFCQICGDRGELILCPSCPVSVHANCCGIRPEHLHLCSHHHCKVCLKSSSAAGGLIYCCQTCPDAFCADCLPSHDITFLGATIPRYEELDYIPKHYYFYIHCSKSCEEIAKIEFGYTDERDAPTCPPPIDVSYAYGAKALNVKDLAKKYQKYEDPSKELLEI